jgi:hypothetical protein
LSANGWPCRKPTRASHSPSFNIAPLFHEGGKARRSSRRLAHTLPVPEHVINGDTNRRLHRQHPAYVRVMSGPNVLVMSTHERLLLIRSAKNRHPQNVRSMSWWKRLSEMGSVWGKAPHILRRSPLRSGQERDSWRAKPSKPPFTDSFSKRGLGLQGTYAVSVAGVECLGLPALPRIAGSTPR